MWRRVGQKTGLVGVAWPAADAAVAREDELELPVQVNGKVRARITVAREAPEETIRQKALEAVASHTEGKQLQKVMIVPGRLVSVVVK
jgi:leucyl-tRNA synthetase